LRTVGPPARHDYTALTVFEKVIEMVRWILRRSGQKDAIIPDGLVDEGLRTAGSDIQ
jgi:hypothetical protein